MEELTYHTCDVDTMTKEEFNDLLHFYDTIFPDIVYNNVDRATNKKSIQGCYDKATWILAKYKDIIVGMVTFTDYNESSVHVYNLGVLHSWRKRGLGKILFTEKISTCVGHKSFVFSVDKNDNKLIDMYTKWGAISTGEVTEKHVKLVYQQKP